MAQVLDIDLSWRMHKASDGQRRRVQICMGLLKPYKVYSCRGWNFHPMFATAISIINNCMYVEKWFHKGRHSNKPYEWHSWCPSEHIVEISLYVCRFLWVTSSCMLTLPFVVVGSPAWWDHRWPRCASESRSAEVSQKGMWRPWCNYHICNPYIWWSWGLAITYCMLHSLLFV